MHDWPATRRNLIPTAPSAAGARSASSNTMKGAFPPSSNETRLSCWLAPAMRRLPTSVEPVNAIFRKPAEIPGGKRDLAPGLVKRFPVLLGHQPRQVIALLGHQLEDPAEDLASFQPRRGRPRGEGFGGLVDGLPRVVPPGIGKLGQRFARGGIGDAHRLAARCADPRPAHIHLRTFTDDTHAVSPLRRPG